MCVLRAVDLLTQNVYRDQVRSVTVARCERNIERIERTSYFYDYESFDFTRDSYSKTAVGKDTGETRHSFGS